MFGGTKYLTFVCIFVIMSHCIEVSYQDSQRSHNRQRKHCQHTGHYLYASCCPRDLNKTITHDGLDILSGGVPGQGHCKCQLILPVHSFVDLLTFKQIDGRHIVSCALRIHHAEFIVHHNVTSSHNTCRHVVHLDVKVMNMNIHYDKVVLSWDQGGSGIEIPRIARIKAGGQKMTFKCGSNLEKTSSLKPTTSLVENISSSNNSIVQSVTVSSTLFETRSSSVEHKITRTVQLHMGRHYKSGRSILFYVAIATSTLTSCAIIIAIIVVLYKRITTSLEFDSCSATYTSLSGKHVADDLESLTSFTSAHTDSMLLSSFTYGDADGSTDSIFKDGSVTKVMKSEY